MTNYLKRHYQPLNDLIKPEKVLLIYGARRIGKTSLIKDFLKTTPLKYKFDSGDNIRIQELLSSQDFDQILDYAEGYDLIVLDEAQNIPKIGSALKILIDNRPELRIIATGSSSFELATQVGEPLTGRATTLQLYPFSQEELSQIHNKHELKEKLEEFLLYGSYPEVVLNPNKKEKITYLMDLVGSYLLKDILALEKIKASTTLFKLLKLLAFQIGNPVSHHELATQLAIDSKTVTRYIDLLEKSFVITPLSGLSKNPRTELSKKNKYFFLDNGIRNAIISQFNTLENRNDLGALWENFIITERLKHRTYHRHHAQAHFWKTYQNQEIDLIEEADGTLAAYEIKLTKEATPPKSWQSTYPNSTFTTINKSNYLNFLT